MIHAYDDQYLDDAMICLGEAMDYVANICQIEMDRFLELFIGTGYAEQFGSGVPKYVSGLSGTELAMDILTKSGIYNTFPQAKIEYSYSPQYWSGWILAYYQWLKCIKYSKINKAISIETIKNMYNTLHEADITKCVGIFDEKMCYLKQ